MIEVLIPIRTGRGLNDRLHWGAKARSVKAEREAAYLMTKPHALPCVVTITRLSPGRLDDDNNVSACKGIRDGIADRLGIDDRDARVHWLYGQERSKEFGVRVRITGAPDA